MLSTKLIGNKIAEARKKINLSQSQLSELLFISSQAVGKWERGESMPDIITFNRLAEILGVDLNYFSENFKSDNTEITQDSSLQAIELPSEKIKKKLSWDMSHGNWTNADFSGLKNLHEKFSSSNMQNCKFIGSDLSGLILKRNNVDSCDFSGCDLSNSNILNSYFTNNLFIDCSLKETEFSECYLYGCDFTGSDLTGVKIKSGGITGVVPKNGGLNKNKIADTVMNRTSFIDSQIADIVFTGKLDDCYFDNCSFTRVTFMNAILINTFFKCKNLKRIKFINCQADRLTYEFLKNGNANLTGISNIKQ